MTKRIIAILLCVATLCSACLLFSGCGKSADDKGAYITMYLTDELYDFDPANAYYNTDTYNVVSLLFDTLFTLDANGEIQRSLVKDYHFSFNDLKKEYKLVMTLRETYWSDGNRVSAEDVVFAWQRIMDEGNSYECASLLYDVKNARAVKAGNEFIDQLGVKASGDYEVTVDFEYAVDQQQFLMNLTSVALAPLRESDVKEKTELYADWAKKPGFATSGAYKLSKVKYPNGDNEDAPDCFTYEDFFDKNATEDKSSKPLPNGSYFAEAKLQYFVLERNPYYYRNKDKDAVDSSVTPYMILCDCTKTDAQLMEAYQNGEIFYIGAIPFSVRNDEAYADMLVHAKVTNALSTFVLSLNENAVISGDKLFAIPEVRQALSLAIDRNAIAEAVRFADAATGLIPNGIFSSAVTEEMFRDRAGELISTSADLDTARALLEKAGIVPSDYTFTITVDINDDIHVAAVNMIAEYWGKNGLGFDVKVEKLGAVVNNDYYAATDSTPTDIADNLIPEAIQQVNYEVIAYDNSAYTADAFGMLAPLSTNFSGNALAATKVGVNTVKEQTPNKIGYASSRYDLLLEAAYYLQYYRNISTGNGSTDYKAFGYADNNITSKPDKEAKGREVFNELMKQVGEIYDEFGISTEKNLADGRATLLAAAEKQLIDDMAVIPVLFNQNAILVANDLNNVSSTYYTPATFRKATLYKYEQYVSEFSNLFN